MLKKSILISIIIFSFLQMHVEAKSQYSDVLLKVEKSMFNMVYDTQSDEARLDRIEQNVYGNISDASISIRFDKLKKDLSTDFIGQETKPQKDSFLNDDEIITDKQIEDMDFSIVNDLEKKVFQYEFKTIDINNRLSTMESQVFKKCYLQDDLSTRIKRLKCAVFENKFPEEKNEIKTIPDLQPKTLVLRNLNQEKISPAINLTSKEEKTDKESNTKLATLEKAFFNKSFQNEDSAQRLVRLETRIFQSTFSQDDDRSRLTRIESVEEAKKSILKYKGNRTSKLIADAIEFGTILLMFLPLLL